LYNFEKLCGYKFSINCIEELVKRFPNQIVGVKDSSYNLFEKLKIDNFSVLPGSEEKLLKGLELGCSGIITATCNVTASLARKVYDDFNDNKEQKFNKKLCSVRKIFEEFNLISAIHSFMAQKDKSYINLLPPLSILNNNDQKRLFEELKKINFNITNLKAA
jgi:4-hydroxy-tetrahydrodipicolinate synthase